MTRPDAAIAALERLAELSEHRLYNVEVRAILAYIKELERDNAQLREWFAVCYAGASLYHDDGELQDSREHPFIDFKRDSIPDLQKKLAERLYKQLAAAHNPGAAPKEETT